jgi:TonB family protein
MEPTFVSPTIKQASPRLRTTIHGDIPMTNLKKALSAVALLLAFGASTQATLAQTVPESVGTCAIQDADARPLTSYPADWPSMLPSDLRRFVRGPAMVQFDVTADGVPQNAITIKSTGFYQLDHAAKEVVLSQRYAPAIRGCVPVLGTYFYEVTF